MNPTGIKERSKKPGSRIATHQLTRLRVIPLKNLYPKYRVLNPKSAVSRHTEDRLT
jgi:hypothetical protein